VIRPFILNEKDRILSWASERSIKFVTDKTNQDISFDRNYIRRKMMPHVKRINPGIQKTIKKKILKEIENNFCPCCGCDPCDCHGKGER
jgi:tRNA(Ile)-lysidine synthase TilS/MesJ